MIIIWLDNGKNMLKYVTEGYDVNDWFYGWELIKLRPWELNECCM